MDLLAQRIPYRETRHFSRIVLDYVDQADTLRPFFRHGLSKNGWEEAISAREKSFTSEKRNLLLTHLQQQYQGMELPATLEKNIKAIGDANALTVTTAHQPNLFTGPLYVIYKILHAIQLANHLAARFPGKHFVPVYYMGSEDADLDELGHFYLEGTKYSWPTKQTGAVGKMKVDKDLVKLIGQLAGQVGVHPFAEEILDKVRQCYTEGALIQEAMFRFLHQLFGEYGLVVLIADSPILKKQMIPVFKEDLLEQRASLIVEKTSANLGKAYKVQASPRAINLFYLVDGIRNRIELNANGYQVVDTDIHFSQAEILAALESHPERFSPNVILRGLYQETILPNIAFIGGGGELAYWLQLNDLFTHYQVPYPVLVLRNSFLVVEKSWQEKLAKTGFDITDYFQPVRELTDRYVSRASVNEIRLNGNLSATENVLDKIKSQATAIDPTLGTHTEAIKVQLVRRLKELEKKMLRAEKRKFADQQRQIQQVKDRLFPGDGLQERIDNFIPYYAKWGKGFLDSLLKHSLPVEQEFTILTEK